MTAPPEPLAAGLRVQGVQRRTVRTLAGSQVLGGVGVGSGFAVSGLLAEDVSGSTTLSGFVGTAAVLGAAAVALPLARLTSRRGRRAGLSAGWLLGAAGAAVMVAAAVLDSFALLLLGALAFGAGSAANLQSRFAATDLAEPGRRARALGVVVWATTVGAVLGPNLTGPGASVARALGLPELAGPFLFSVLAFAGGGAVVLMMLRPDPLLTARSLLAGEGTQPPAPRLRTSLSAVRRSPAARLGLLSIISSHVVMVAVMVMTPVHMRAHGAQLSVVGVVISVHVAGMYAFSPVVGWLSDRVGRLPVMAGGMVLLLLAAAVAGGLSGSHTALGAGLFLLGLGWSCGLVAGSTLLSECVPAAERPGVQGASDFLMNLVGGLGGAASGAVLAWLGYGGLTTLAAAVAVPVLVLVVLGHGIPKSV